MLKLVGFRPAADITIPPPAYTIPFECKAKTDLPSKFRIAIFLLFISIISSQSPVSFMQKEDGYEIHNQTPRHLLFGSRE